MRRAFAALEFVMRKRAYVMKDVSHPYFITRRFFMAGYSLKLKRKLFKIIRGMEQHPEQFALRPGKDFTRKGKLGLQKTLSILLCMEGKSLQNELLSFFSCAEDLPSASALVQSRAKLSSEALPFLFRSSVAALNPEQLYKGYRLFAVDGSTLHIPDNPSDKDSLVVFSDKQRPSNLLHLNALYDLCSNTYCDAIVEGKQVYDEQRALVQMAQRNPASQAIYIADRGYESFILFAQLQQLACRFLVRVRETNGIVSGLLLPSSDEFDCCFSLKMTSKKTKQTKLFFQDRNHFKYVRAEKFKAAGLYSDKDAFFTLHFRVVRFRVSEDSFETIITNLDQKSFNADEIKSLYIKRWGIETSFRKLKYTLGLLSFHAKKVEYIRQEIFARLIMYNFTELITSHITIHKGKRKYAYQANFSSAVQICRQFLRGNVSPPLVEALISKFISPIRPDRSFPRTPPARGLVSFTYRIA